MMNLGEAVTEEECNALVEVMETSPFIQYIFTWLYHLLVSIDTILDNIGPTYRASH